MAYNSCYRNSWREEICSNENALLKQWLKWVDLVPKGVTGWPSKIETGRVHRSALYSRWPRTFDQDVIEASRASLEPGGRMPWARVWAWGMGCGSSSPLRAAPAAFRPVSSRPTSPPLRSNYPNCDFTITWINPDHQSINQFQISAPIALIGMAARYKFSHTFRFMSRIYDPTNWSFSFRCTFEDVSFTKIKFILYFSTKLLLEMKSKLTRWFKKNEKKELS